VRKHVFIPPNTRFGRLVVIDAPRSVKKQIGTGTIILYPCMCDCGTMMDARANALRSGNTASCGCLFRDSLIERNRTHGLSRTPEYRIWKNMRRRCNAATCQDFKNYGGRGIGISERWNDFKVFVDDMGKRPSKRHSIDRIDFNGDYCKENCRWATAGEQANNTRMNYRITIGGQTKNLSQWAREYRIGRTKLRYRLKHGWGVLRALTE
jgi:hypothetical protein